MTRSVVNRRIAIPSSPSSMNNSNYHHNTHGSVSVGSHCLQLGVIFIVISVLIIDGIAIFSYSNLFETTTVDNGVTRHLRQYEVQRPTVESETDDAYIKVASLSSSSSSNVNEPKIVWLMSFPNSGTSYTSQLVRDTTHTVSASNYADETPSGQEGFLEPVYEDQIEGPFWIRPEDASIDYVEPTQYIITKVRNECARDKCQTSSCVRFFSHMNRCMCHMHHIRHTVVCVVHYALPKSTAKHPIVSDGVASPQSGFKSKTMGAFNVSLVSTKRIVWRKRYISSVTHSTISYRAFIWIMPLRVARRVRSKSRGMAFDRTAIPLIHYIPQMKIGCIS